MTTQQIKDLVTLNVRNRTSPSSITRANLSDILDALADAMELNAVFSKVVNNAVLNVTGNVLIGTTTDNGQKLQINGNLSLLATQPTIFFRDLNNWISQESGIFQMYSLNADLRYRVDGTGKGIIYSLVGNSSFFTVTGDSSATLISVLKSGTLLINTATDNGNKLQVNGNATVNGLIVGGSTLSTSAIAEMISTTKGFLPPRMTTAQINAIASPVEGLFAYSTDADKYKYYNGSAWVDIGNNDDTFIKETFVNVNFQKIYGGAGFFIHRFILRSSVALPNLKIGYTNGGSEIYDATVSGQVDADDANHTKDLQIELQKNITATTTIYFSGITGTASTVNLWTNQRTNIPT